MELQTLVTQLSSVADQFVKEADTITGEAELRLLQTRVLGKKGPLSEIMRDMGKLPPDDRRALGAAFNDTKQVIEGLVEKRLAALADAFQAKDLQRSVDVTLPGTRFRRGHLHLLTQVRADMVGIFAELGFELAEGPQIDTDFHCFEALAIPANHPARDMQDTFYVSDDVVLRTHTSTVQIRTMMSQKPPVRIIAPGVVYRRDDDATHSPMFTQIEGLLVDEGVRFSDLRGVLEHFVSRFFGGEKLAVRFRPSYFPFVEPGAEVDMQCAFCKSGDPACRICKGSGWLEIGGAGMVDPDVFAQVKYDSETYTGFAFGMGIERMAMLRHGIRDIKYYYQGDVRFVRQF